MRVPLHEQRVLLNLPTIRRCQCSSVHGGMPFSLNSRYIKHGDLAISIGDNQRAILSGHRAYVVVFHHANAFRLNVRLLSNATDRSTCMEGPHGKLCARLSDGLGGNDPDSFPYIYQFPGCEISTIASSTYAAIRLAGKRRAYPDPEDASILYLFGAVLVNIFVGSDDNFLCTGVQDILCDNASGDSFGQRARLVLRTQ